MCVSFFQSRRLKNALTGIAAAELTSGIFAAVRGDESSAPALPHLAGLASGVIADSYTRTGNFTLDFTPADGFLPLLATFLQITLANATAPLFFEGDAKKAHIWTATTLGVVCAGLAACITPNPAPAVRAAPQPRRQEVAPAPAFAP